MSQEFERIANELSQLQLQIIKNELPILLITFIQNHEQNLQVSIDELINSLMSTMKKQFINNIAMNIGNVKMENSRMRAQNQELRELVRKQCCEAINIKTTISHLNNQKECLNKQLNQLKTQQVSLEKLINSSSIELKIKQILKQNEDTRKQCEGLKQLVKARGLELNERDLSLKAMKQKQLFYTSEIKALQNDNNLFYQDLSKANNQIKLLQQARSALMVNQSGFLKRIKQMDLGYKSEIQEIKKLLDTQQRSRKIMEQKIKQHQTHLKYHNEQKVKQIQKYQRVCEQNKYLRQSLQNLEGQLMDRKQQQDQLRRKLQQFDQYINEMTQKMDLQQKYKLEQLSRLEKQKNKQIQYEKQIVLSIKKQLQLQKQRQKQVEKCFNQCISASNREKQKLIEENQTKIKQHYIIIRQFQDKLIYSEEKIAQLMTINEQNTLKYETALHLERQNAQYYKIYLQQNNQLKGELQRLISARSQSHVMPGRKKYLFLCMQVRQTILRLAKQKNQLKILVSTMIEANKRWMMKQINKLVCFLMQKKIECESCLHWQKYQTNKKLIKDHKLRGNPGQIRSTKDLKALTQKFKLIKEQNELFGNRIQQIIHD